MSTNILSESSYSATINAPIEFVDIPTWLFNLPDAEYQRCSPAHIAAGFSLSDDGKRMSLNVEVIGGSLMVQHYVEDVGEKDHCRVISTSDVLTPTGRTKVRIIWELSVKPIDANSCEFTNHVKGEATPEFMDFLGKNGVPFEQAKQARQAASSAHNAQETPMFAKSIEAQALKAKAQSSKYKVRERRIANTQGE